MVSRNPGDPHDSLAQARAVEVAENAASIAAIPDNELPDAGARAALVALARAGHDVYAYRPVASPTYVLWVRDADPTTDSRWVPAEWARQWRAQLEIGGNARA